MSTYLYIYILAWWLPTAGENRMNMTWNTEEDTEWTNVQLNGLCNELYKVQTLTRVTVLLFGKTLHLAPSTQEFKYQQTDTLGSHSSEVKILPVAPCHQNWDGLWRFGPFSRVLACEVRWEDGRMGGINDEWTFNQ